MMASSANPKRAFPGFLTFFIFLLQSSYYLQTPDGAVMFTKKDDANQTNSVDNDFGKFSGANQPLKFAAFNIQIFGEKKMAQKDVVEILLKILNRYDLILIEEIRDSQEKWTQQLLDQLNEQAKSDRFKMIISERLGRSSSKEQYAFFYRERLLSVAASFTYDDGQEIPKCVTQKEKAIIAKKKKESNSGGKEDGADRPICQDSFQREPFIVRFKSPTTAVKDFSIIACHTDPNEAVQEIDSLADVYKKVKSRWDSTEIIIAGDLNAGCAYMPKKYWPSIRLRDTRYWKWLIADSEDTTSGNSNCAYDRFIISKQGKLANGGIIPESVVTFDYQQFYGLDQEKALRVSDHFPIELQLQPQRSNG